MADFEERIVAEMVNDIQLGRADGGSHQRDEFLRRFARQHEIDDEYAERVYTRAWDLMRANPDLGISMSLRMLHEDATTHADSEDDVGRQIQHRSRVALAGTFTKVKQLQQSAVVGETDEEIERGYLQALQNPDPALRRALRKAGYVALPQIDIPPSTRQSS